MSPIIFKSREKQLPLPVFFPDATRAVLRMLDSKDIEDTHTPGILVNTFHLYKDLGKRALDAHGGVREFMSWKGGVISDSGGFQVMSLVKRSGMKGKITDKGMTLWYSKKNKIELSPQDSIHFQMVLKPDMVVVLDDFTTPDATPEEARDTVERTIRWAKLCKIEFEKICKQKKLTEETRPYLLGVVQGGMYLDLRAECTQRLVEIGFDGLGYGGWPVNDDKSFNYDIAEVIAKHAPDNYLLYGLGIGKPEEIVGCVQRGFHIFDCVLPTRDARHKRLYVYTAKSIEEIDVTQPKFYEFYTPDKEKWYADTNPISTACDCLLCTRYTRAYLAHLFRIDDMTAKRLATIHNLRFYSILMEKLRTLQ